jgi:D-aminopeptidase
MNSLEEKQGELTERSAAQVTEVSAIEIATTAEIARVTTAKAKEAAAKAAEVSKAASRALKKAKEDAKTAAAAEAALPKVKLEKKENHKCSICNAKYQAKSCGSWKKCFKCLARYCSTCLNYGVDMFLGPIVTFSCNECKVISLL